MARLRGADAALRRPAGRSPARCSSSATSSSTRTATRSPAPASEISLTATEFELLRFLMRNPRRVLSKAQILDRVWNYDFGGQANVVELYISYLRKKIDAGRDADDPHDARRRLRAQAGRLSGMRTASPRSPRGWSSPRSRWSSLVAVLIGVAATAAPATPSSPTSSTTTCARRAGVLPAPARDGPGRPRPRPASARRRPARGTADLVARRRHRVDAAGRGASATDAATRPPLDERRSDVLADVPADGERARGRPRRAWAATGSIARRPRRRHRGHRAADRADVDEAVASLIGWEALLIAARRAAGRRGAGAARSYAASCARCTEVAATAHAVAELPLSEGEIDLTERVPDAPHRRAHRGRPGRRRAQHPARPRRDLARGAAPQRAAGAPVRRRRLPRAAHPAGHDRRLHRAGPAPARRRRPSAPRSPRSRRSRRG